MEENIRNMIEKLADEIVRYKNKWAEIYFNTLTENNIVVDDDAVFDLFNDLLDGLEDVDDAVNMLISLKGE